MATLTGAMASPKPSPHTTSATSLRRGPPPRAVADHEVMATNDTVASTMPARPRPGARANGSRHRAPPATAPIGYGYQEAQQHQRRSHLRVGIDGGPGEERDVDQGGHEGGAEGQVDDQGTPCRAGGEGAGGDQRGRRPALAPPEEGGQRHRHGGQHRCARGHDLRCSDRRWRTPPPRTPGLRPVGGHRARPTGPAPPGNRRRHEGPNARRRGQLPAHEHDQDADRDQHDRGRQGAQGPATAGEQA